MVSDVFTESWSEHSRRRYSSTELSEMGMSDEALRVVEALTGCDHGCDHEDYPRAIEEGATSVVWLNLARPEEPQISQAPPLRAIFA